MKAKSLFAVTALALASVAASADPQYTIIDLGIATGGVGSQGFAISSNGSYTFGRSLNTGTYPGFIASGSSRTDWTMISPQLYVTPAGGGVNNAGVAVTGAGTTAFGSNAVPIMYKNGTVTTLAMPSGYTTGLAADINNSGTAVGQVGSGSTQRAAIFNTFSNTSNVISDTTSAGSYMTSAKAINDNGLIVGTGLDVNGKAVGLVYNGSTLVQLDSGYTPTGISEKGLVVGTDANTGMSFTWSAATGYVDTGVTGTGTGINNDGWIVGKTGTGSNDGYLYDGSMSYLLDDIVNNGTGWSFNSSSVALNGIANNGDIVGTAMYNGVAHAVLLAPVPEPTSWALMLAGLGAIGAIARRRTVRA